MRITLPRGQTIFLLLLALGTLFVLGSLLLHTVVPIHGWPILLSSLNAVVPGAMYGGGFMFGG
jgi:hypothetical protein